jgi:hypothetical protein
VYGLKPIPTVRWLVESETAGALAWRLVTSSRRGELEAGPGVLGCARLRPGLAFLPIRARRRFPSGMTTRGARAKAPAQQEQRQLQRQQPIQGFFPVRFAQCQNDGEASLCVCGRKGASWGGDAGRTAGPSTAVRVRPRTFAQDDNLGGERRAAAANTRVLPRSLRSGSEGRRK